MKEIDVSAIPDFPPMKKEKPDIEWPPVRYNPPLTKAQKEALEIEEDARVNMAIHDNIRRY